ncbi:DUF3750 domain-containing protein [Jannaschia pohangensis]|uniref:DUF3750 domain-containing protein n=1 Tax=Jannaschia pohangensis TaxID=390807 RepID=A0A1I3Q9D9_9RHOB|nr:DUF3750 domain-containing protein [Jannaschia pohangensis]SFJ30239.1 Protein of unknown function [Jannaschia pohangensis]
MIRFLARLIRRGFMLFAICFLLPVAVAALWWQTQDHPQSWRAADWGASGVLQPTDEAAIHVLAARTGGQKGAVSVHSWLVWKPAGDAAWTRAEVVGWGRPVRLDAYAPDGKWYSNVPFHVGTVSGPKAARLIPLIRATIDAYPYDYNGSYTIWPGPNSNTFVSHILRQHPEIGIALPPHAVGKDFIGPGLRALRDAGGDLHLSAGGYAGLSIGPRQGFEVNLLGQTFGFDLSRPALKLPGIGRVGLDAAGTARADG